MRAVLKQCVVYAVLLVWSVWIGFPLYMLLTAALRQNVVRAFAPGSVALLALGNSVVVSIGGAGCALVFGAMAGYGLARFEYRVGLLSNERIRFGFLAQRMFPVAVLAVPYLLIFRTLNLLDSAAGILIGEVGFGTPFLAWLVCDSFRALPRDVEESAMLDGCSRAGVLRHIVVPLSAPALAAAFTLVFIMAWNDYFLALVVTFSQSVTLPLYIQAHPMPAVMVVSILPPVIVGVAAQRALARGLSFGIAGHTRA
jgi:multiple sugar transport system permease protein